MSILYCTQEGSQVIITHYIYVSNFSNISFKDIFGFVHSQQALRGRIGVRQAIIRMDKVISRGRLEPNSNGQERNKLLRSQSYLKVLMISQPRLFITDSPSRRPQTAAAAGHTHHAHRSDECAYHAAEPQRRR